MDAIFIKKKVLSTLKKIPQTKKCNMSYTQIRQCTLKKFLIRKIVVLNLQVWLLNSYCLVDYNNC
jgi:hypothetical protein